MKIFSQHVRTRRFLTVGALVLASLSGSLGLGLQSAGASTPTGVLSPFATLTNSTDTFWALTVDTAGNLYTVDTTNCKVIKIDATTQDSSVISSNTDWCGKVYNMTYAVVAGTPTLIIPDYQEGAIYTVPAAGGDVTQVGYENGPSGVAYDSSSDTLYIADWYSDTQPLWKITSFSTCTNASNPCTATEIPSTGVDYARGLLLQGSTLYSLSYATSGLLASIPTSGDTWTLSYDAITSYNDFGTPAADPAGNIYYLDVDSGKVYELPAGGSTSTTMTISGESLSGLLYGGPVYFNGALYALDGLNGQTGISIVKITLPAAAPTNVTATPGNGSATVSWTASPGATSYTVTSSPGGQTCTATVPSTSCVVSGLTNGTSYTFSVVATNSVGASGPSMASAPVFPSGPAVTVAAATLAKTGSPLGSTLLVGLCALSLGTTMILGRRRRHQVS